LKKAIKIIEQDKSGAQDIICNKSVEVVIFYLVSFHFFYKLSIIAIEKNKVITNFSSYS